VTDAAGFDAIAARYDALWTHSVTGRLQRRAVWRALDGLFRPGERVVDLGCGTGEDALWLARRGVAVNAVDGSPAMLRIAARRAREEALDGRIRCTQADIARFAPSGRWDGAISDFGALNTIADLRPLARALGESIEPGGRVAFCVMGRLCLWETAWFLLLGRPARAFRRMRGTAPSSLGVRVYYHSARSVAAAMKPAFTLLARRGIGVCVPPSYLEPAASRVPRICGVLARVDRMAGAWPVVRSVGDHELLVFVRN
jgi:SAM-dependent methyltransferase